MCYEDFVANERTVFVMTGTTSPSAFDSAMPAFRQFIENFSPNVGTH